ncbi:symmetrical bis(5'-nucleosyl)-tetraphosphatase [Neisseriaceae bacterium TC5R-5]|nr:symmetrical bis(5'-nucleosyl)-tetraphosphatase [Neisseriaceae bacterium TC5R-5]
MAIYAIGDIQGCFAAFQQLLRVIEFNPGKDSLWLTGDLVNRGPQSLEVLRWVFQHQDQVTMVLGNHDLHLLALAEGFGRSHRSDTLDQVLNAADGKVLLDWLRCQPLMLTGQGYAMVHAGLLPEWTIDKALDLAEEVEDGLSGPHYRQLLSSLYGNRPVRWGEELKGSDRIRVIVNAMTRMRLVNQQGEMDLSYKGGLADAPAGLLPWFEVENRRHAEIPVICGHWSALGCHITEEVVAIDSGCLWGGSLTAFRLDDRAVFTLPCPVYCEPGA